MSAKIRRLVVGRGITTRPGESEEWVKRYYELELEIPANFTQESFEEARLKAEAMISQWLSEVEVEPIPQLDVAEIQSLPWVSYQTHQPCTKPEEAGWVFTDPSKHDEDKRKVVRDLALAIDRAPKNKLEIGGMLYTFSGPKEDKKLFISRRKTSK